MASRKTKVISLHPKNNSFFWKPTRNKQIPNIIVTLFLGLELIYGLNFGFTDILNKKLRPLCQYISNFMSLVVTTFILLPIWIGFEDNLVLFLNICTIIPYMFHSIFLHVNKYKLYNFIKDIRIIAEDVCSGEKRIGGIAYFCIFLTFIFFVSSLYACFISRYACAKGNTTVFMLYAACSMGLDVTYIVKITIYYYIYNTVKHLKRLVNDGSMDLDTVRKHYVLIADCSDKIETLYGNLVLLDISTNLPKLLAFIFLGLYFTKLAMSFEIIAIVIIQTLYTTMQLCGPAAMVQVVCKLKDSVQVALYNRLLEEHDVEKNLQISNLLRYMEKRPLHHQVWGIIPVDNKFIMLLFNLSSTYIVVTLQFTHLYD